MDNTCVPQDSAEKAAFKLIPMYTGAELQHYDHSGRQGAVDALLHFPDGRIAALEVTSAAAPGQRQLESIRRRWGVHPVNPGQWTWLATVRTPRDFAELKDRAGRIILRCEELGITRAESATHLTGDTDFDWLVNSKATLRGFPGSPKLGGADPPLPVLEGMSGGGRNEGPRDFEDAVDDLIRGDHVVKRAEKLRRSGYTEQHLFIMVHESALPESAHFSLRMRRSPFTEIELPPGVTHLWLLVAFTHRLLLATVDGWQSFELDSSTDGGQ